MITITLIEDHKMLSGSIRTVLMATNLFKDIVVHHSADDFINSIPVTPPELIITDLIMPGKYNGLALVERCREVYNIVPPIIVLSSITDVQTVKQLIRLGVKGYLSKDADVDELVEAIDEVYNGRQYIGNSLRDALIKTVFTEEQIVYHLSPREREVLHHVCSGLTIKEIAYNLKLSKHTVQYYHKCVLSKLKLNRTSDLIVFAMQNGLYIPEVNKK